MATEFSSLTANNYLALFEVPLALESVDHLCKILEDKRGRRINLIPFALRGTNIDGILLATRDSDIIIFDPDAPLYHQKHTQLHELSHIICGHLEQVPESLDAEIGIQYDQFQSPSVKILRRADYENEMEREAEIMASLLAIRLQNLDRPRHDAESTTQELCRINQSLSHPGYSF